MQISQFRLSLRSGCCNRFRQGGRRGFLQLSWRHWLPSKWFEPCPRELHEFSFS